MEKIPFADYVCSQIAQGKFISASTKCNYLIYGAVVSGERQEYLDKRNLTCDGAKLEAEAFDPDSFRLCIKSSWFGLKRETFLSRQTSPRGFRQLTVTPEQAEKLYDAWKIAAVIQEERNTAYDKARQKETDRLHWWP